MTEPSTLDTFLTRLRSARPEITARLTDAVLPAAFAPSGSQVEAACVMSPTRRPELCIWLWTDREQQISMGFGSWQTHAGLAALFLQQPPDVVMAEMVSAILDSQMVITTEMDGPHKGLDAVLRINGERDSAGVCSQLASAGYVRIRSWDGSVDEVLNSPPESMDS